MPELLQQFQAEKDAYVDSSTKLAGNILVQTCLIYTNIAANTFVFSRISSSGNSVKRNHYIWRKNVQATF